MLFSFHFPAQRSAARALACLFVATGLFFSCKKDEPAPEPTGGKYAKGVFVVNEGPFNGTGTITWHDPATQETEQKIFERANGGASLGQFVQSLVFHRDLAYVVVNGGNKIVIVEPQSFEFLDTIGGLALPRYFLPLDDNTALVSQWGADGLSGSVVKIDLRTRRIVAKIPVGKGPEKMLRRENTVLVANSGGFGVDSTVSIIDLATNTEKARISVPGKNPSALAVSQLNGQEAVYVLCGGSFSDAAPSGWVGVLGAGKGQGAQIPAFGADLTADKTGQALYFTAGGAVYRIADASGKPTVYINQACYGMNVRLSDGALFCADAKDFNSAGECVVYKNGQKSGSFTSGIAPGEIVIVE